MRSSASAIAGRLKTVQPSGATGIALAQELSKMQHRVVKPIPVERDKVGRLFVEQQKFVAGLVHFPKGAAFLPELEPDFEPELV
jgi:hypothetical protein